MRTLLAILASCGFALPLAAADPPVKNDRYGDPLPDGALMRLGTLRCRAPINSFGIKKDGTVVTVGDGGEIRFWRSKEVASSEPVQLPAHKKRHLNELPLVSPDGMLIASHSEGKLYVWHTPTDGKTKPKEAAVFEIEQPWMIQFSPNGEMLVLIAQRKGNRFPTVHLCDIKTGKITDLEASASPSFTHIQFSGDGKRVGATGDKPFFLWDTSTGKLLAKHEFPDWYGLFALNSTGDLLARCIAKFGKKEEWYFTDPISGKDREGFTAPDDASRGTFTGDGKTMLFCIRDSIVWWDPAEGKLIRKFEGLLQWSSFIQPRLSPDEKLLVMHTGKTLFRWDAQTGKPLFPEQDIGHTKYLVGVSCSPDGKLFATTGDWRTCIWDAGNGKLLVQLPVWLTHDTYIEFSPDSKYFFASGPEQRMVTMYEATTGKAVRQFMLDPGEPKQRGLICMRLSSDGKSLVGLSSPASAVDKLILTTWDTETGKRVQSRQFKAHYSLYFLQLSPDAKYLAFGMDNPRVIEITAPDKPIKIAPDSTTCFSSDFSRDGKWLIQSHSRFADIGHDQDSAVVISTENWKVVRRIPVKKISRVALSPDGGTLAASIDEEIIFYDVATSKRIGGVRAPHGAWEGGTFRGVQVLRFTPDGKKLITGHADTTALVWPVPERVK